MPAAETQTALHDSVEREVGTSSGADKHFQLRQRHQKSKGWQMGLAQPICFKVRQVRLAATARLFPLFTQHAVRPPPKGQPGRRGGGWREG